MYLRRVAVMFYLAMAGLCLPMCAKTGSEPKEVADSTAVKWPGDNMSDFAKEGLTVSDAGAGFFKRVPYNERRVGIAYTTWHRPDLWAGVEMWTFPNLGKYNSDERTIIRQHAEWLADAGVDFVWVDWSNNLDFGMIERSTLYMFEEYSKMRAEGKKTPSISIFIGNPDPAQASGVSDGRLSRKANQVYDWFVNNPQHPEYKSLLEMYNGKPLLVSYAGTPTPWQTSAPPWTDSRFTVRFMTGFVTNQSNLYNSTTKESVHGYWSWEDRGAQSFTVDNGFAESMIVVPSWRPQGKPGDGDYVAPGERKNGKTFKEQWARARLLGVRYAMVGTWNEYVVWEQYSAEVSKDIEPNAIWGDKYMILLKEEIKRFKGIK
jgi:hypothetical protein